MAIGALQLAHQSLTRLSQGKGGILIQSRNRWDGMRVNPHAEEGEG